MTDKALSHTLYKGTNQQEERRQEYVDSGWWVSIPLNIIPSHWLNENSQRLDAGYYSEETSTAMRILRDGGFPFKSLKDWGVTAYHPTQNQPRSNFKRILTTPDIGTPFLSATEIYAFRPTPNKYLSPAMKKLNELFVYPGTLLMSRSGTVAIPVLVNRRLASFAATDDALRISPGSLPPGFLYAYLSSWVGRALVRKSQYGVTVKHLEAAHLVSIECPVLPEIEQKSIHDEIQRAYDLRDEANDMLDEADVLLHQSLCLPRFDESQVSYLPAPPDEPNRPSLPHPRAFTLNAAELDERLDASYHVPSARTAVELLRNGKYDCVQLKRLASDIFVAPRFKRIYVSKEYGVAFLQGSHLPQIRPYDLKYLSRSQQKGIERWIIRKGWILITCSGTIGRVGLVSSYQDQWAASQHLLRIVPDYIKGHPGYIAAFLMTPYGQHQIAAKIYGGVVDELTAEDMKAILIPDAPEDVQNNIGNLVVQAYEKRDEANAIEESAIRKLEGILQSRE
jgi:type I restriction enzyme S subunit